MLLKHKYYSKSSKIPWHRPLFWTFYCLIIVVLFKVLHVNIGIPLAIPSILGTAISLFLGFRTNSAYQRWWEARKVWGEIVNNSRTLARQVLSFGRGDSDFTKRIIHRQIAWNWSLAYRLRDLGWSKETEDYLVANEIEKLKNVNHVSNIILLTQEKDLREIVWNGDIDDFDFRKIDATLKELCDSMGKCERIKSTVFPTQYSLFTLVFINTFLVLLPLGMVTSLGYFSIPIHIAVGFTFGMIQSIAESMQDPFENRPNDVPIFSICRTIERNLLEMAGLENLPESYESKDGVLM
jgi:putative membrane protein